MRLTQGKTRTAFFSVESLCFVCPWTGFWPIEGPFRHAQRQAYGGQLLDGMGQPFVPVVVTADASEKQSACRIWPGVRLISFPLRWTMSRR